MDGHHILYVECEACGHEGTAPGDAVKGRVERRLAFSMAPERRER
jgi:hypothetical protein